MQEEESARDWPVSASRRENGGSAARESEARGGARAGSATYLNNESGWEEGPSPVGGTAAPAVGGGDVGNSKNSLRSAGNIASVRSRTKALVLKHGVALTKPLMLTRSIVLAH